MKKKMYTDEELLRDKMLRHEFQADEQAWTQMESMLDGNTPPPSGIPPHPPTAVPGASATFPSVMAWVAGLGLLGLLALLAVGPASHAAENTVSQPPQAELHKNAPQLHQTQQSDGNTATPSGQTETVTEMPATTAAATSGTTAAKPSVFSEKAHTTQVFSEKNRTSRAFSEKNGTSALTAAASAAGSFAQQNTSPSTPSNTSTTPKNLTPSTFPYDDAASSPVRLLAAENPTSATASMTAAHPEHTASETVASRLSGPDVLPQIEPTLLHVQRTLPLPKAPVTTRPAPRERRFQVGAALGGQWAIVDRNINKITLLPTYGLSLNAKIAPRWWAETGLMWRQVSGYDLMATWDASGIGVNGLSGKWAVSVEANQLNFLEVPLLLKYALPHGDQRFMAGVRYARVFPRTGGERNYWQSVNGYGLSLEDFRPEIKDGVRRHDLALSIGVEARIYRNLWADIRHNQGLYDLTYDSFFSNTQTDRTAETQLTLRYYFWSF